MVGASASAGFVLSEPMGGKLTQEHRLNRFLDAAVVVPHDPVKNLANATVFMKPQESLRGQIERAVQAQPAAVVGIDFLFWCCYGITNTEEQMQQFNKGLTLLEGIQCPLVIGDIPDASGTINIMLDAKDVPGPEARAALNQRLKEWAAAHKQVTVLGMNDVMRAVMANEAVTVRGTTIAAGKTRALIQGDNLHPTSRGCAVLALMIADALQSAQPALFAGELRRDPDEVLRAVVPPKPRSSTNAVPVPAGN
jgi:hypothetical protein